MRPCLTTKPKRTNKQNTRHDIDFTCLNTQATSVPPTKKSETEKEQTKHLHVIQIQVRICAETHQNVLACKTQKFLFAYFKFLLEEVSLYQVSSLGHMQTARALLIKKYASLRRADFTGNLWHDVASRLCSLSSLSPRSHKAWNA